MDCIKNISEFPEMEEIVSDRKTLGRDFFYVKTKISMGTIPYKKVPLQ